MDYLKLHLFIYFSSRACSRACGMDVNWALLDLFLMFVKIWLITELWKVVVMFRR